MQLWVSQKGHEVDHRFTDVVMEKTRAPLCGQMLVMETFEEVTHLIKRRLHFLGNLAYPSKIPQ